VEPRFVAEERDDRVDVVGLEGVCGASHELALAG
jgi:hypothetical protein